MRYVGFFLSFLFTSCVTYHPVTVPFEQQEEEPSKISPNLNAPSGKSFRKQNRAVSHLLDKSRQQLTDGHLDLAISSLERAYRIDYQDPEVSLQMARVLYSKGRERQAEQWAMKSLGLWSPSQVQFKRRAWELISQCRLRLGDLQGANEAIEAAKGL